MTPEQRQPSLEERIAALFYDYPRCPPCKTAPNDPHTCDLTVLCECLAPWCVQQFRRDPQ
ncbi:MAG: hypothetical protein M3N21_08600 [Actinomycetota bacterium]|nr:hypothetical protein [Actinomycetota bacterium]